VSSEVVSQGRDVLALGLAYWMGPTSPLKLAYNRDWTTIVLHMRARGNLTKSEANAVRSFLQATNGIGDGPPASPPQEPAVEKEGKREGNNTGSARSSTGIRGGEVLPAPLLASLRRYLNEQAAAPPSIR
jgi:hypothetical protein